MVQKLILIIFYEGMFFWDDALFILDNKNKSVSVIASEAKQQKHGLRI